MTRLTSERKKGGKKKIRVDNLQMGMKSLTSEDNYKLNSISSFVRKKKSAFFFPIIVITL